MPRLYKRKHEGEKFDYLESFFTNDQFVESDPGLGKHMKMGVTARLYNRNVLYKKYKELAQADGVESVCKDYFYYCKTQLTLTDKTCSAGLCNVCSEYGYRSWEKLRYVVSRLPVLESVKAQHTSVISELEEFFERGGEYNSRLSKTSSCEDYCTTFQLSHPGNKALRQPCGEHCALQNGTHPYRCPMVVQRDQLYKAIASELATSPQADEETKALVGKLQLILKESRDAQMKYMSHIIMDRRQNYGLHKVKVSMGEHDYHIIGKNPQKLVSSTRRIEL